MIRPQCNLRLPTVLLERAETLAALDGRTRAEVLREAFLHGLRVMEEAAARAVRPPAIPKVHVAREPKRARPRAPRIEAVRRSDGSIDLVRQ